MTLKSDAKFDGKLENDMRNLANFHQSIQKSQNWDLDKNLWSKVENVWASNLRGVICHDNEQGWKIWRKNDLCFQKWQEELDNFHKEKNSDFILESKMAELNQNKNSNNQINQMQCENFFNLENKWIAN